MEIPLLAGRDFAATDAAGAPGVAILSRRVAEMYWPAGDALGRQIRIGTPASQSPWLTIVGIAGDVRHPLDSVGARFIYLPLAQGPTSYASLLVRSSVEPQALRSAVEQAIWSIDKGVALWGIGTVEHWLAEVVSHPRFTAVLITGFGSLALLLAVLGVYSASAYAVRRRTRELGIRIALGAQRAQILRMLLVEGLRVAAVGILLGLIAAAGFARTPLVASQLAAATPGIALACVLSAAALLLAALAGCWLPARRATHVDPVAVLRDD
jgi:putative ABC transport system permease protein